MHSEGATTYLHLTAPSVYHYHRYLYHSLLRLMVPAVARMAVVVVAAVVGFLAVVVVSAVADLCGLWLQMDHCLTGWA